MPRNAVRTAVFVTILLAALAPPAQPQTRVTTPKEEFGHDIGADYVLPNYQKLMAYWQKLARESDRMELDTIGVTAQGRPHLMAIVTSPENHRNLARYQDIARRLALAEGVTDEQARALAREGKAVVWIDGGLHASEVLGAQQLMETLYQMVSGTDEETMRILRDVIILFVHANPDGHDLVADWYMRNPDPMNRSTGGLPVLYHHYIGHDDNRDFFASTQKETENMNRVMYREWFPQIVYNHHQSGPQGTVMFAPPFRDPFNYNFDPLVVSSLDLVAAAMHSRFIAEGKPGVTMRTGASYSTWWNGGLRTTAYFHNMIGILTETIGNPNPQTIPFMPQRLLPKADMIFPIEPQVWHFRQSVDYSVTANKAVFGVASDRREDLLYNMYKMGVNQIAKGNKDSWTDTPRRIAAAQAGLRGSQAPPTEGAGGGGGGRGGRGGGTGSADDFRRLLRAPELRDPRGFIVPSDQRDFPTATKFIETLLETGVTVHRATREFQIAGKTYPAGSFVVKGAQAFRPHVLDMFEPQDHPDDIPYPGAPPTAPYDITGYTLAYQMGVKFDRIMEAFDGPFEVVATIKAPILPGRVSGQSTNGYLLSHAPNDAFTALNRLLAARAEVHWLTQPVTVNGKQWDAGTFYIRNAGNVRPIIDKLATEKGLSFESVNARPAGESVRLRPVRIALWDTYGGSMPSGWTRWIFEQFEFPFEVVYPPTLDAGNLKQKYDVIVFVGGAIPGAGGGGRGGGGGGGRGGGGGDALIPPEFAARRGSVTVDRTIPQIKTFLEQGGTVIAIGSSTSLANHLGLPVQDHLVEPDGRPLPEEKYYVPGSVLRARVDNTVPIAHGMEEVVDFFYDNNPVFKLGTGAEQAGLKKIAWFEAKPLRSGWAYGERYLENGIAAIQATVGRGQLYLFGPEVAFRAQPHGTFKLLFNGIYYGPALTPPSTN
jgi:hypothetical protein